MAKVKKITKDMTKIIEHVDGTKIYICPKFNGEMIYLGSSYYMEWLGEYDRIKPRTHYDVLLPDGHVIEFDEEGEFKIMDFLINKYNKTIGDKMDSKEYNQEDIELAELESRETKSRMFTVQNKFTFALNEWLKYDMTRHKKSQLY